MFPGPVCVSLAPKRIADLFASDVTGANCIEARLDYLDDPGESVGVRWDQFPVPVIATCRGRDRGGRFGGPIEEEMKILERAVQNGARWVDVDFRFARSFGTAGVIGSCHDFDHTPNRIGDLMGRICESQASVAKLATMVRSWSDNRRLFELLEVRWPRPVIVIGMGAMGQITRVLGPRCGSQLTYVSSGPESAPGQVALRQLLDTYRFGQVGPATRIVGVVGNPVEHSASPVLHNRAFGVSGLDYVYLKFPVEDIGDFLASAARLGIEGFSVTIPHKVEIMRHLDRITPEARSVGAVNTVWRKNGEWIGDNTDVYGIRKALKHLDLAGLRVVILGTGGAARAAVAALDAAASITLLSTSRRPGVLDWTRQVRVDRLENAPHHPADLLINATPVGMSPNSDATPVSGSLSAQVVFDMVYSPAQTRLLDQAATQGLQTISGTAMFVAQAARQFEIWTGQVAPSEVFSVERL